MRLINNSRYGNLSAPAPPKFEAEHAAIDDLLKKGEITANQAFHRHRRLQRDSLMYIAKTNGGYQPKRKGMRKKWNLSDQRDWIMANKARELVEAASQAAETIAAEENNTAGDAQAALDHEGAARPDAS